MRLRAAAPRLGLAALAAAICACAVYRADPLPPAAAIGVPAESAWTAVAIRASEIRHPLIPAIAVNLADGLSPDEAALLAVAANPELRAARAARGVVEAQVIAAGILPNPQISAAIDRPTPASATAVTGISLGAALDLLAFVTRGAERDAARQGLRSVDLGLAWQEWQVAEEVRIRTFALMLVEKALVVAGDQEREMAATVTALRDAAARQLATKVELGAAEIAYRTTIDAYASLSLERDTARVALARMLGVDGASMPRIESTPVPFGADTTLTRSPALPTLDTLLDDLGSRRLDLQGLRVGYLSQEARVRAAVLRQFPQVTIGVNRIRDTGNLTTLGPAATILFPLFNRNQGEIAVTRATRAQLRAEYEARVSRARANVAALLIALSITMQRQQNLRASIIAQQETVDLYRRALQSGNADVLTYYVARGDLMNRRLQAIAMQRDLVSLTIALEAESGLRISGPAR